MRLFAKSIIKTLLGWETVILRSRLTGPVIVITGSVGKTSAREVIGLVVRQHYGKDCLVSPKNLNTDIGVPLALFGYGDIPTHPLAWFLVPFRGLVVALFSQLPQCFVLEFATDRPGDIAYLARLLRPTHAVLTNVSEAHTQLLGGVEAIRAEKVSLLQFVASDGVIILNADDKLLQDIKIQPGQKRIFVSLHHRSDYFTTGIAVSLQGTEAILHHANRTQRIHIHRYGAHHLYSVLFGAAIGDSLGIAPNQQLQAFKAAKPMAGRGMLLAGRSHSLILDETYNGQPAAMKASLQLLGELAVKKRIAILGEMRELRDPEPIHREIGRLAHTMADVIIGIGPNAQYYKPNQWFMTAEEAIPSALNQLSPDAMILIKGAQGVRLERIVKALMLHPEQAPKVLVRQNTYWLRTP